MEIKNEFNVSAVNETVVVKQTITKIMGSIEAVQELQKLRQEQTTLNTQRDQLDTSIKANKFEQELDTLNNNVKTLVELEQSWTEAIAPALDKLRTEVKAKISGLKAAAGYDRADKDVQMVKRNKIIAEICTEFELNADHPVFVEIRREFDKI